MSKNQESESENDASDDSDSERGSDSGSGSEYTSESEDEDEILARLRARKKQTAVVKDSPSVSPVVSNTADNINDNIEIVNEQESSVDVVSGGPDALMQEEVIDEEVISYAPIDEINDKHASEDRQLNENDDICDESLCVEPTNDDILNNEHSISEGVRNTDDREVEINEEIEVEPIGREISLPMDDPVVQTYDEIIDEGVIIPQENIMHDCVEDVEIEDHADKITQIEDEVLETVDVKKEEQLNEQVTADIYCDHDNDAHDSNAIHDDKQVLSNDDRQPPGGRFEVEDTKEQVDPPSASVMSDPVLTKVDQAEENDTVSYNEPTDFDYNLYDSYEDDSRNVTVESEHTRSDDHDPTGGGGSSQNVESLSEETYGVNMQNNLENNPSVHITEQFLSSDEKVVAEYSPLTDGKLSDDEPHDLASDHTENLQPQPHTSGVIRDESNVDNSPVECEGSEKHEDAYDRGDEECEVSSVVNNQEKKGPEKENSTLEDGALHEQILAQEEGVLHVEESTAPHVQLSEPKEDGTAYNNPTETETATDEKENCVELPFDDSTQSNEEQRQDEDYEHDQIQDPMLDRGTLYEQMSEHEEDGNGCKDEPTDTETAIDQKERLVQEEVVLPIDDSTQAQVSVDERRDERPQSLVTIGDDSQHHYSEVPEENIANEQDLEEASQKKEEVEVLVRRNDEDATLTLIAEVDRLRCELDKSENRNAQLSSKVALLEDKLFESDEKASKERISFDYELERVTKQQSDIVQALTSDHQLQVQEYVQQLQHTATSTEEDKTEISELSMKLSEADCSYMELDAFVRGEPERQQDAIRLALEKDKSNMEHAKGLRPEIGIQSDPDEILLEAQREVASLVDEKATLQDEVDVLNYKVEELEGEIISARNEFEAAAAQYASVASTVVDHDDRANVLQFKLQAANAEVDRSNRNCQELQVQYDTSQKELRKSNQILQGLQESYDHIQNDLHTSNAHIQELRTKLTASDAQIEAMTTQFNDVNYELQLLSDDVNALTEENTRLHRDLAEIPGNHSVIKSDSESLPAVKVMRSTVAEEPDQAAENFAPTSVHSEPLFPGVHTKQSPSPKKTTKKQQASENYRKQQNASASEPNLPKLAKNPAPAKKKKTKKLKSKLPSQFDDGGSVGSALSPPKKLK